MSSVMNRIASQCIEALVKDRKDESAWRRLSEFVWPIVVRANSLLRGQRDPESLHSEVLSRLYRHTNFSSFPNGQGFTAYIWTIVRRLNSEPRSEGSKSTLQNEENASFKGLSAHEEVVFRELLTAVTEQLNDDEIELAQCLLDGMKSREEIAQELGVTLGGLATKLSRLKSRIQSILEP